MTDTEAKLAVDSTARAESPRMTAAVRRLFFAGDCAAGALMGVLTTLVVRAVISPGFDMVAAMMIGMALGTLVHLVFCVVLAPLLGMFETMVPGMFIGMNGGMLFGMRDSMQDVPLATASVVDAVFGVAVVLAVAFWNVQLRKRATMWKEV